MRTLLVVALVCAVAPAAVMCRSGPMIDAGAPLIPAPIDSFYGSQPFCKRSQMPDGFRVDTFVGDYTVNSTVGEKMLCYRSKYIHSCFTIDGVRPCNQHTHRCVKIGSGFNWDDAAYHPEYVRQVRKRPSVCLSKGAFMSPDSAVVFVAQVMFSWVLLTTGTVMVAFNVGKARSSAFMKAVAVLMYIPLVLMFFSYYYLNAILGFAAFYCSFLLFSRKNGVSAMFAVGVLLLCFYWVTFQNGLGDMQHHSRLAGFSPTADTYVSKCNNYYSGFFFVNDKLRGDFSNPEDQGKQYCDREWLSAGLFWMINFELLIFLAVLAGALYVAAPEEPAASSEKPAAEDAGADAPAKSV